MLPGTCRVKCRVKPVVTDIMRIAHTVPSDGPVAETTAEVISAAFRRMFAGKHVAPTARDLTQIRTI